MAIPDLCSEEEVRQLVHAFYAKVRTDSMLAPVFARHVSHWDRHLAKMVDFWTSQLRGSNRYQGTPMPVHMVLPGLTHAMFERWLDLFFDTTQELANPPMRSRAIELAQRIAQALWDGYQFSHGLDDTDTRSPEYAGTRPAGIRQWIT
jgi:hemoglobin